MDNGKLGFDPFNDFIVDRCSLWQLHLVHSQIQEMVKFGEAKNGVLLTVNFLILYKIASEGIMKATLFSTWLNYFNLACLIASIIILFISFIPKLVTGNKTNPLYFGFICSLSDQEFIEQMKSTTHTDLYKYYCQQVHTNAKIAYSKFSMFRFAVVLAMLSFIGSSVLMIIKP